MARQEQNNQVGGIKFIPFPLEVSFSFIIPGQNLDKVVKLRLLSIQSNRITKIEGLDALVNLEELYMSHNGLTKLEGLDKNVGSLTCLCRR